MITLDADTRLPRGAAKRLIGKMAHPLNRPRLDRALRPRGRGLRGASAARHARRCRPVARDRSSSASSPARAESTRTRSRSPTCTRICSAKVPTAARESTTSTFSKPRSSARVPDNTLLSHDLLEGIFARAGLVSDIEVVEEFPSRYDVAAARQHRWARGDWQLLPWIFGRGHGSNSSGGAAAIADTRAIPLIGRWKMIDNLRRTLSAPAAFLALLAGWTLLLACRPDLDAGSSSRRSRCRRCCRF